jgi:Spy/CpxP family protein refolding chaperone
MQRPRRTAVNAALTAAVTAAVALAVGGPAAPASAQPPAHASHHAEHHAGHARPGGSGPHSRVTRLAVQQRQLLREIDRVDGRLTRLTSDERLAGLGDDERAAVAADVAGDHAVLSGLADTVRAATTTDALRPVRTTLRRLRPEAYTVAVLDLRRAARLQAVVDQNTAALAAVTDRDVSAGVTANQAAAAALADAVAKAVAVTAASSNADLHAVHADLRAAHQALGTVADVLAGTTDPSDPDA